MASNCSNCGNPYAGSPCPYCNAKRTVPTSPDHIADANKKAQPARAPLCGGDEFSGCAYHCGDPECAQNKPAPAPLPGEVENALAMNELFAQQYAIDIHSVANLREYLISLGATKAILLRHISDLTRRLAEANTEILRQHKAICLIDTELGDKIQIWRNRAEAAEARVREVVAEAARRPLASDDEQTIADLEAFKARVTEWARGDCCACSGMTEDKYGQRVLYTEKCYGCVEYGGDDDAVSLWAPAWEVGE